MVWALAPSLRKTPNVQYGFPIRFLEQKTCATACVFCYAKIYYIQVIQ